MKKLMIMAMGLGLVLGSVSFAQDAPKTDTTTTTPKKTKKTKKTKKPATDASTTTDKKM